MSKCKMQAEVLRQTQLTEDIFDLWIKAPQIAEEAKAGQFVSLYTKDGAHLLPRPISICETDRETGSLRLVYRIAGYGTGEFSGYRPGDFVEAMGPLGNGFPLKNKKAMLIGGGIGIPPMLELAKELDGEKEIVAGYRDVLFLAEDLEAQGRLTVATEDGSAGTRGNVLDAIREKDIQAEVIYACGPTPMLRAVKAYAAEKGIECWLSLEERMACGVGACLACVCKSKEVDSHSHVHNKGVCKDGPVFEAGEVEL